MIAMLSYLLIYLGCILNCDAFMQDFYWRDYIPGYIPHDVVPGIDGKYIGQVNYRGNLPATIYPHLNVAIAELLGKREIKENIKILCSPDPSRFYWEIVDFHKAADAQMKNVVKGGYQEDYNLFIGRAYFEGEWRIGKVIPIDKVLVKGLRVWDQNDRAVKVMIFHILKYNSTMVLPDGTLIFQTK